MPVDELNKRLENIAWGAILVTIGTIGLVPQYVPHGTWLIAAGLILLGLNVVRYLNKIAMRGLSLVLGILALLAGLGEAFGVDLPLFAISLIVIGGCILLKPVLEREPESAEAFGQSPASESSSAAHADGPR